MMLTTSREVLEIAKKLPTLRNQDLIYLNYYLNVEFKKRLVKPEVEA